MRGSPLIRTFVLCLGLVLAAVAVHHLTRRESATITPPVTHTTSEVMVESAGKRISLDAQSLVIGGELTVTGDHPAIFLTVRWADPTELPRFAKLQIEPPSQPTRSHTFDAIGDIDDVWEPHLH